MGESLAVRRAEDGQPQKAVPGRILLDGSGKAGAALQALAERDHTGEVLTAMRHFPAREAQWAEFPEWVNRDLRAAYEAKGIERLYSHQSIAVEAVHPPSSQAVWGCGAIRKVGRSTRPPIEADSGQHREAS